MAQTELSKLERETTGLKLFPLFALLGWVLIIVAVVTWLAVLGPTASSYWGGNAKEIRDAAEVGSGLLGQLTTLATVPKWLVPLVFVGIASFMLAIAAEFAAIPGILDRRIAGLRKAVPLMGRN